MENPSKRQKCRTQQDVGDSSSPGLWLEDNTMRVGLCFKDISELKKAVDWWSIKRQRKCLLIREMDKDRYAFECLRWGCKWSIRASRIKEDGLLKITKCTGPHTCRPKYASEFKVKFIDCEIERAVRVQPMVSVAELDKLWEEKHGYSLDGVEEVDNDAKGVLRAAKEKAIKRVFGDWDKSFGFIPKLMSALQSSNGLLVDWQYDSLPNTEHASFRGVFWAFPQSIQGFQHCRPLIVVDTKNLGGKYKMKLMIASAFDAANQYFPLAFAVTKEVSVDSWRWFLTSIRDKVTQRQGICLISSPDPDIVTVINEPGSQWKEPWAYHRFCLDHLCSQLQSVSSDYDHNMEYLVGKAGSSSKKEEFDSYMLEIKEKNPEAWKWLDQIPPHQWALVHDSGSRRYGIMRIKTQFLFAVCKRFPKAAMAGGVMLLFGELRDAFEETFSRTRGMVHRGDVYTDLVMEKFDEFKKDSTTCVITTLERDAYQVSTASKKQKRYMGKVNVSTSGIVQLNESTCTCGKFQSKKFPCLHALAVCDKLKINPLQYVDDCYTVERYHKTYAAAFSPLPELSAWPEAASGVPTLLAPVISQSGKDDDDDYDEDEDDEGEYEYEDEEEEDEDDEW
ncbi:PREDICTED: uncharacterized protein LOC104707642 [Camelina sativa]|uniref:Uncharacterized protein LOC104707642 n=1 Tax=Camelina sativa TaxID=90675 RepID=A0ABM0T864_CAMSA|nr:PREDICTED: uncharacterized protein LOC104707642 [Camelina sativa]